jgi:hypothetical protein
MAGPIRNAAQRQVVPADAQRGCPIACKELSKIFLITAIGSLILLPKEGIISETHSEWTKASVALNESDTFLKQSVREFFYANKNESDAEHKVAVCYHEKFFGGKPIDCRPQLAVHAKAAHRVSKANDTLQEANRTFIQKQQKFISLKNKLAAPSKKPYR